MRAVVVALTALLVLPATTVGTSGDMLARKALRVAKAANAKATKALASVPLTGPQGAPGTDGNNGVSGTSGVDGTRGMAGVDGARGADGQKGDKGDVGTTGAQGVAGSANLNATSVTNDQTVSVGTSPTVVLSLDIQRDTPGSAFLVYDGQINGENATPDGVLCELRLDAATVAERFQTVGGTAEVDVAGSALTTLNAGQHTAALDCQRGSTLSNVSFPSGRTRLTVLAG